MVIDQSLNRIHLSTYVQVVTGPFLAAVWNAADCAPIASLFLRISAIQIFIWDNIAVSGNPTVYMHFGNSSRVRNSRSSNHHLLTLSA